MTDRTQLKRMIDSMERALSIMERQQEARQDALDREMEGDCRDEDDLHDPTNPLKSPPNAPFSDGAPQHIHGHGQPKRDLF